MDRRPVYTDTQSSSFQRRWLSGQAVPFIVCLIGLILTVVAYTMLNIFVNRMITADYRRLTQDTQQSVSQNILATEQSLRTAVSVISLSPSASEAEWKRLVLYAVPRLKEFDRLILLRKDTAGNWRQTLIYATPDAARNNLKIFAPGMEETLKTILLSQAGKSDNGIIVLTNVTDDPAVSRSDDLDIQESPYILAQPLAPGNPNGAILVGASRVTNVVDSAWLDNRPIIQRIIIRDMITDARIFDVQRNAQGRAPETGRPAENFQFAVGNTKWQMLIDIGDDDKARFLGDTPLLILIAGLLLTVAATIYLRNALRQSARLQAANRALGQKNIALNTEVAERERLNNVLRTAEREYRAIMDSVSDIIFELSIDGEILFLNNTWEKTTNFAVEQVLNRKLFDMIHPQDQEEQRRNFDLLLKGQKAAYRTFTRIRTASGTFRGVELAMSMMRQDENRNMRVVGTLTDVEERRRAERALVEAEKKYRTIVENAAGGIFQVTPDGQFLSANPAMARIIGYDTSEQMLRQVKNAHEDLYENMSERNRYIRELEMYGSVKNFEIQARARDGRKIWVNENARAVKDDEGNLLYFEGSMEDVTKRKEVEIKLREAKIQSDLASRAKSEFLTNMSHELRTPLNAIIGFSEIIKDEVLGPLQNRQYWEYSRDIYDSGRKLLNIINEILDVSRIDAGDRQLNEGIVDLNKVAHSCIEFIGPKAEAGRLTVTNMLEGRAPKVIGEELAVKQIILNLLSNAIKFTPPGGRITLSHEIDGDGQLRVSITDTGVGLDEVEIEKALSPFGQVETALSRSGSGAGLGLTLVNSLIKLHGGRLELFSQKGIGTTATIIFPARRVAQETI